MSEMVSDRMVEAGEVPIAVREYGGTGPAVLLLHGAGGNLAAWDEVGPMLAAGPGRYRTVAVDLRGHGASGDGPWSWDAVLADLAAVVAELELENPALVGHSLGGGLAAWWARRHTECPAVVSLDGHRSPVASPEHHDAEAAGLTIEQLRSHIAQLDSQFDAQQEAMAAPLTDDQVDAMLAAQRTAAERHGVDPDRWTGAFRRGLVRRNGATYVRPGPEITRAIRADVRADALPLFAELRTPFLMVLATRSLAEVPPDLEPLMVAFRAGLRRDLRALAAARPNVEVHEIDASHGLLFEKRREVTELVSGFVGRALAARSRSDGAS